MKYLLIIILFLFSIQFSLAQDKPDGPHKEFYDSGELKKEGQYKNNKRIGEWKRYYKNGQVSRIYSYNDGKFNKEEISYFENGIVSRKTKKEDGVYVRIGFYESGNIKYKWQDKSGYFKSYYENGSIEIEAKHKNYDPVGEWKRYFKNGKVEWLVNYKDGVRDGIYKNFYKNGNLKLEGKNKNDKKEGEEKRYLPNMILEWEGDYNKDRLHNTWTKYDANGKKVEKIKFYYGAATNSKTDTKLLITEVPDGVLERVAIYPGCENSKGNSGKKKCMNKKVNEIIKANFNTNSAANIGLSGIQRIFVTFKVDKTGEIIDIKAKAPHPKLIKEAIRVINLLPKLKPGKQSGKTVIMPFSVPIIFQVKK
ncbi:energy transducer TonB [Winogradskyella sp. Asnod2-B02-A]|uniref:energy transducer TonB n=1 Tax=Winogradskyella sp. Asnod2-B02-A TaxID=3160583 RepID=UPI00386BF9E9